MSLLPLSPSMMTAAGPELCQVYCNGRIFEGWTAVSVSRSTQDMAGRFRLSVTEAVDGAGKIFGWQIRPGDPVQIKLGGVLAVDGFVDIRQAAYDAESHGVEIAGRSKTADAIEAAAVTDDGKPAGPFAGYALDEIARALLAPYAIGLKVIGEIGAAFPMVTVQVGESVFEVIERLARLRGFHLTDGSDGTLVLANKVEPEAEPVGLVEGVNILAANAMMDVSKTASEIFVFGQTPGDDDSSGAAVANQTAVVKNDKAPRKRPKVVVMEEPGDKEAMKARGNREIAQEAERQAAVQVTVQGWLLADGTLWAPGKTVKLTSPMLLIDRDMLVAGVEFAQSDSSGTITTLDLVTPEAFALDAPSEEAPAPETEDGSDSGDEPADDDMGDSASLWSPRSTGSAA